METKIEFKIVHVGTKETTTGGVLVLGAFEEGLLFESAQKIDLQTKGHLKKSILSSLFKGKKNDVMNVLCPQDLPYDQVLVVGFGKSSDLCLNTIEEVGAKIMSCLLHSPHDTVTIHMPDLPHGEKAIARLLSGMELRSWQFNKYKTTNKEDTNKGPSTIIVPVTVVADVEAAFKKHQHVNQGNFLTRTVITEPPNVIYPESMVEQAKALKSLGVSVEVLDESAMRKLGMNALLGVGQGSIRESQLIILQWHGGAKSDAPLAVVGKGVTFDSGGISIKPSANMEDMKADMGGSGVVLGLMKALALRKAKANVVGIMGMVENMPSGSAQRPADIVKSMSGQTIEVLNTDADGRLVLADALWYTQDRFKPKHIIDLATLTGAIIVSLGHEHAGLFSNNDDLAEQLLACGKTVNELLWRLPLSKAYDKDIDSDIADVKNIGSNRGAGSITAAQFLQRFVNNVPWAHLDIAGMVWDKKPKNLTGKGPTGFGVRLLNTFIEKHYETTDA